MKSKQITRKRFPKWRASGMNSSAILSKAFEISQDCYYNSVTHFYGNIQIETGYSINTIKKELKPLFQNKTFEFKDNQILVKINENLDCFDLPSYILNTRKIKIGSYWLKEREYKILLYIESLKGYVENINKERGTRSPIYVSLKGIVRALGCTYSEARNSMHKIELYFETFWLYEDNFKERIHPKSRSLTIKLPAKEYWQKTIEAKVMEMTGTSNLEIKKPHYIKEGNTREIELLREERIVNIKRFW